MIPTKQYKVLSACFLILISCNLERNQHIKRAEAIQAIHLAEVNFSKLAAEKGIAVAFTQYADNNAVIKRKNDSLINGVDAIKNFYHNDSYKQVKLSWSPDFIDASMSGDLGYTYGKYEWVSTDSTGKTQIYTGIFHTVWKKQKAGDWKFVWD